MNARNAKIVAMIANEESIRPGTAKAGFLRQNSATRNVNNQAIRRIGGQRVGGAKISVRTTATARRQRTLSKEPHFYEAA
jgi:hypothetical protein